MAEDREAFRYRTDVLDQLLTHGVRPTPTTRPELMHEFVSDLYRYELRTLRARLLKREFPRREYFDRVVELRRRYWLVSLRPSEWLE